MLRDIEAAIVIGHVATDLGPPGLQVAGSIDQHIKAAVVIGHVATGQADIELQVVIHRCCKDCLSLVQVLSTM